MRVRACPQAKRPSLRHGTVIASEGSEASTEAGAPMSKSRGLGGYADAKLPAGDCASGLGLLHANHVFIQSNFPRVTDIATVLKSLLDSSIARHLHTTSSSNRYCDSFKVPAQHYSFANFFLFNRH